MRQKRQTIPTLLAAGLGILYCFLPSAAADSPNYGSRFLKQVQECRDLIHQRHMDRAQPMIRSLLSQHQNSADLWSLLGASNVYQMDNFEKRHAEARRCLKKAIALDPQLGEAYYYFADLENFSGNMQAAIPLAMKATTVAKPDINGYRLCAVAYSSLGKQKEALAAIDEYLRIIKNPTDTTLVTNPLVVKAGILESMGRYRDAEKIYSQMMKTKVSDTLVSAQVRCLVKLGEPDAAIASLTRLIASNPHDEAAYRERAKLNKKLGRFDAAIKDLTSSIDEMPSSSTYLERADLYKKINRLDLHKKDLALAERL